MSYEPALLEHELRKRVGDFFKDPEYTSLWFKTPNPFLGDVSPEVMLWVGRGERLLEVVDVLLKENGPPKRRGPNVSLVAALTEDLHKVRGSLTVANLKISFLTKRIEKLEKRSA